MIKKPFNGDERQFIHDNYKGRSLKELTDMLNERFGTDYPERKVKCYKGNHRLSSGLTGRFEKGNKSFTKGLKVEDFMKPEDAERFRANQFKRGHCPGNHRPVGSEGWRADGYLWVKVAEPKKWRPKHVVLWERATGRKKPEDSRIIFLDGDVTNFDPDNLECVSGREHVVLNNIGLRFADKELTKTGINIVKLKNKIADKEKDYGN